MTIAERFRNAILRKGMREGKQEGLAEGQLNAARRIAQRPGSRVFTPLRL